MVMIFKNKKALKFLFENGHVYTFRLKKRKLPVFYPHLNLECGKDWVTWKRGGKKLAIVGVYLVREVKNFDFTDEEVMSSGFTSKEEWIQAIKQLNKGKSCTKGYLYLVVIPAFYRLKEMGKHPTWPEINQKMEGG